MPRVYLVSDHDPSGLDLQRSWEEALRNFCVAAIFVRIGLTREQVNGLSPRLRQGIEVKPSDSRAAKYVEQYGNRCWEADVLPASDIQAALDRYVRVWLDAKKWARRAAEIEKARALL